MKYCLTISIMRVTTENNRLTTNLQVSIFQKYFTPYFGKDVACIGVKS